MNKQNFDLTFLGNLFIKCLKTLELPGGFVPLAPLPGLCPGPTGGLTWPPDPSPNNFAPPIYNSWLRPCDNCFCSRNKLGRD